MDDVNNYMQPLKDEHDELNESIEEEDDNMNQQNNMIMNGYDSGPNNFHSNGNMNDFNNPMMHHSQQQSMF